MTSDEALAVADHGGLTPKDNHDAAVVLAAELLRYRAMQCCGCQRWDVRGAEMMGRCGKWLIQTPALHGCFAWEKRDA